MSLGLLDGLDVPDVKTLDRPKYGFDRDSETGVRNVDAILAFSAVLADAVEEVIREGGFPLVVGGDCSILLGSLLGLQRCGTYGLLFVDGHRDFLTPESSVSGGVAGMDLAIVTGVGVESLVSLGGSPPLVAPSLTAALGFRDIANEPDLSARIHESPVRCWDVGDVRRSGPELAEQVLGAFPQEVDGYWLHVDVDVLSSADMPAVDSPQPGGLSFQELQDLLSQFVRSGEIVGMQVTIYDPDLDPSGVAGSKLVECLRGALGY